MLLTLLQPPRPHRSTDLCFGLGSMNPSSGSERKGGRETGKGKGGSSGAGARPPKEGQHHGRFLEGQQHGIFLEGQQQGRFQVAGTQGGMPGMPGRQDLPGQGAWTPGPCEDWQWQSCLLPVQGSLCFNQGLQGEAERDTRSNIAGRGSNAAMLPQPGPTGPATAAQPQSKKRPAQEPISWEPPRTFQQQQGPAGIQPDSQPGIQPGIQPGSQPGSRLDRRTRMRIEGDFRGARYRNQKGHAGIQPMHVGPVEPPQPVPVEPTRPGLVQRPSVEDCCVQVAAPHNVADQAGRIGGQSTRGMGGRPDTHGSCARDQPGTKGPSMRGQRGTHDPSMRGQPVTHDPSVTGQLGSNGPNMMGTAASKPSELDLSLGLNLGPSGPRVDLKLSLGFSLLGNAGEGLSDFLTKDTPLGISSGGIADLTSCLAQENAKGITSGGMATVADSNSGQVGVEDDAARRGGTVFIGGGSGSVQGAASQASRVPPKTEWDALDGPSRPCFERGLQAQQHPGNTSQHAPTGADSSSTPLPTDAGVSPAQTVHTLPQSVCNQAPVGNNTAPAWQGNTQARAPGTLSGNAVQDATQAWESTVDPHRSSTTTQAWGSATTQAGGPPAAGGSSLSPAWASSGGREGLEATPYRLPPPSTLLSASGGQSQRQHGPEISGPGFPQRALLTAGSVSSPTNSDASALHTSGHRPYSAPGLLPMASPVLTSRGNNQPAAGTGLVEMPARDQQRFPGPTSVPSAPHQQASAHHNWAGGMATNTGGHHRKDAASVLLPEGGSLYVGGFPQGELYMSSGFGQAGQCQAGQCQAGQRGQAGVQRPLYTSSGSALVAAATHSQAISQAPRTTQPTGQQSSPSCAPYTVLAGRTQVGAGANLAPQGGGFHGRGYNGIHESSMGESTIGRPEGALSGGMEGGFRGVPEGGFHGALEGNPSLQKLQGEEESQGAFPGGRMQQEHQSPSRAVPTQLQVLADHESSGAPNGSERSDAVQVWEGAQDLNPLLLENQAAGPGEAAAASAGAATAAAATAAAATLGAKTGQERQVVLKPANNTLVLECQEGSSKGKRHGLLPKNHAMAASHSLDSDGYHWKKYSHKTLQGTQATRVYYCCSEKEAHACRARKIVDRPRNRQWRGDSVCDVVTLDGEHNHPPPPKSSR